EICSLASGALILKGCWDSTSPLLI
ncbi:hypothetical protein Gotur_025568, partial [Gossypium turneri]